MLRLHHFALCPFSRKVRVVLHEKEERPELQGLEPWRQPELAALNPAAEVPVLEDRGRVICDSWAICEYLDETRPEPALLGKSLMERAEIRRLVAWFDEKLYGEVVGPLLEERMRKRLVNRDPPDTKVLREAMKVANAHLDYLDYLLDHRRWLGGPVLTLVDLTAAAHLSVADYLGGLDWRGHKQTTDWYAVMKSRPSFRPLLGERMEVIAPPPHYDKVDFF
jgi:glutathione S-transferase